MTAVATSGLKGNTYMAKHSKNHERQQPKKGQPNLIFEVGNPTSVNGNVTFLSARRPIKKPLTCGGFFIC
jgi:hypothetical protein